MARKKAVLVAILRSYLRASASARESLRRLWAHAFLAAELPDGVPTSVVALGRTWIYGTHAIRFGEHVLLYPDIHLETQDAATITIGDRVVLSRGVHLVAMAGIVIGDGTMIGEYTSVRDANHSRISGMPLRDAGHSARPIVLGSEVWIGRGVTILGGVKIGDGATVGANAVVTRDVAPGSVVVGIPARPLDQPATGQSSIE